MSGGSARSHSRRGTLSAQSSPTRRASAQGGATSPSLKPEQERDQKEQPLPSSVGDDNDVGMSAVFAVREPPAPCADTATAGADDGSGSAGGQTDGECSSPFADDEEDSGDRGNEAHGTPSEPLTWPEPEEAGSTSANSTNIINSNNDGGSNNKEAAVVRIHTASYYRRTLSAAATIRRAWRGARAQQELTCKSERVTVIQVWWRMVAARALARTQQFSAVQGQPKARGMIACAAYRRTVHGSVRLQALARGSQTRARLGRERQETAQLEDALLTARAKDAAISIQTWHRRFVARRRRVEAERAAAAARVAVRVWMQAAVGEVMMARGAVRATAATKIQSMTRALLASARVKRRREKHRAMVSRRMVAAVSMKR